MRNVQKNAQISPSLSSRFPESIIAFQYNAMVHSYTYKIMLRRDTPRQDGTYPVVLQAVLDRKMVRIPLKLYGTDKTFNDASGLFITARVTPQQNAVANSYNLAIGQMRAKADKVIAKYRYMERTLTVDLFKQEMNATAGLSDNFYLWYETEILALKGIRSAGSIEIYEQTLGILKEFRPNCRFYDLSTDWVADFDAWMQRQTVRKKSMLAKRFCANTRAKHHKTFKFFFLRAQDKGLIFDNIYKKQKVARIQGDRDCLTKEEVVKLLNLFYKNTLSINYQSCLAQFLFSCFTGLRMGDSQSIGEDNIVGSTLIFKPEKSQWLDKTIKIPLPKIALQFLQLAKRYFFNNYADSTVNKYLKEIAKRAGVKKKITYHMARHTFATMFLEAGGAVEVLQKIMGHAKIETTMIYVHIANERKEKDMAKLDEYFQLIAV